jgi:hypothetical protein
MLSVRGMWLGVAVLVSLSRAEVPPPSATPAHVIVSGPTSTPVSVKVEAVGQEIPKTFSKDHLRNAEGFAWYVSEHYALQTDYDRGYAEHLLTLLELAYPHYVELFGHPLRDLDTTRMAVIYANSRESLARVMAADGIEWNFNGGGICYEGINAAFNFPSGSLQYHQRYIMLHEAVHLYQMCLNGTAATTPWWYYEGIADGCANHVWDETRRTLTMAVVDKATVNNWYDAGMSIYRNEPFSAQDILKGLRGGRDVSFLLVNYFMTDPGRMLKFWIWRDELFRLNLYNQHQADSDRLMDELFGLEKLDGGFKAWLEDRRPSFHYVDWGWEQDGDALVSYGWPQSGPYAQTDLAFAPGNPPVHDPLVMDYPQANRSALVDPPQRGIDEPVIGAVVSFALTPDAGVAGLGLGVEDRSMVRVLIEQGRKLVIDATGLDGVEGGERNEIDFTQEMKRVSDASHEIGLTITIGKDSLRATARAEVEGSVESAVAMVSISPQLRERIVSRPVAVISRDGRHRVTPYLDEGRIAEPDLSIVAAANRWRFASFRELYQLERAIWRLGADAPASLTSLRDTLLRSVTQDQHGRDAAMEAYRREILDVHAAIETCSASGDRIAAAKTELKNAE